MIELQATQIPPDVEYGLDTMLEHGDLDAMTHTAVKLYAPRRTLMDILDGAGEWKDGDTVERVVSRRLRTIANLDRVADDILARLPLEDRGALAWAGIGHMRYEIGSLAEICAHWAIEDEICGGCMKPYKRSTMSNWNRRYQPGPRVKRKLYAPSWIRRYVKLNSDASRLRAKGFRLTERVRDVPLDLVRDGAARLTSQLQAQHEGYRVTNQRRVNAWALHDGIKFREHGRVKRKRRAIIKRAVATATDVLGPDMVRDFVRGKAVRIPGQTVDLEVGSYGSSAAMGHSAVAVALLDPGSGRRLANICVYHPRTPAMDQLVAFALAMQAGEEEEIIRTGNLSAVTELGMQHPLVAERGRAAFEARQEARRNDPMTTTKIAYWNDTQAHWTESLGVFTLGRVWKGAGACTTT